MTRLFRMPCSSRKTVRVIWSPMESDGAKWSQMSPFFSADGSKVGAVGKNGSAIEHAKAYVVKVRERLSRMASVICG